MSAEDELARLLAEQMPPAPPEDVVPRTRRRPPRHVVAALLAGGDRMVTLTDSTVVEDVDGVPAGVTTTSTTAYMIAPDLAQLGWTQAEWDDPNITE